MPRTKAKPAPAATDGHAEQLKAASLFADVELPYALRIEVTGVRTYFFARGDASEFEAKEASAPGSTRRRQTDPETLVWRVEGGGLGFPSVQVKNALMMAGRYMPDPSKTGRRSARPFIQEALSVTEEIIPILDSEGKPKKTWDAIDTRLAKYRNGAMGPRRRPILHPGWKAIFHIEVLVPELIRPADVAVLVTKAGMVRGCGDNATYGHGRFAVTGIGNAESLNW